MMWLIALALASPPSAPTQASASAAVRLDVEGGALWGTETLHVEHGGYRAEFDFTEQVHLSGDAPLDPDHVSLRLRGVSASADFDRVASLWLVLAEEGSDSASLTSWIGVLEPERARLAGFPVAGLPTTLALSGDGEVVAWADPSAVYVAPLEAPPRPELVYERDVDPPLFEVEPLLLADFDLDGSFDGVDLSLELYDMVDIVTLIEEDVDPEPEPAEPGPVQPGAQRLRVEPLVIPTPSGTSDVLAALSHRGRELAIARDQVVALWSLAEDGGEVRWCGSVSSRVADLRFVRGEFRATLDDGSVVRFDADGPSEKRVSRLRERRE